MILPAYPKQNTVPVRRRRRSSGGNVILESVFALVPTVSLVFASIDRGLMMFR